MAVTSNGCYKPAFDASKFPSDSFAIDCSKARLIRFDCSNCKLSSFEKMPEHQTIFSEKAFLKSIKQVFNAKVSHNAKVLLIFKIFAFKLPPN